MEALSEMFLHGDMGTSPSLPQMTFLMLFLSLFVGHVIGWIYIWTHSGLSYSQVFCISIVVMPVLVAIVMSLMSGDIVIAFGLLAVFAMIRFRNVLKDTRDTLFILWSIVEGMAVGTGQVSTALISAFFISLVFLYLRYTSFGGRHRYDAILSLQLTGDLVAAVTNLKNTLDRHSITVKLASERRLSDEGVDLSYRLLLRDPSRSNELVNDLESSSDVQNVSLFHREDESEV